MAEYPKNPHSYGYGYDLNALEQEIPEQIAGPRKYGRYDMPESDNEPCASHSWPEPGWIVNHMYDPGP